MVFLLVSTSCGNYVISYGSNPFKNYGISRISVPMFVNKSILPNIAGPLTKEIIRVLISYSGVSIQPGESKDTDAILIGIVESGQLKDQVLSNTSRRFITDSGDLKSSIGNRNPFYLVSSVTLNMRLRVILIQNPSFKEIQIAKSKMAEMLSRSPKVIFSKVIPLSTSFSRTINSNLSPDDGGVINFTNSKGIQRSSIASMAQSAAQAFKGLVVDAF